jgi:hypothetical protein
VPTNAGDSSKRQNLKRGRKTTTLATNQVGWSAERRTKMFFRLTQNKTLTFLPAIFLLLLFFACGAEENIVTPKATTLGTYTSAEEVMSLIKAYKESKGQYVQPSGIMRAPSSGKWSSCNLISAQNGGEVRLSVPGVADNVVFKVLTGAIVQETKT